MSLKSDNEQLKAILTRKNEEIEKLREEKKNLSDMADVYMGFARSGNDLIEKLKKKLEIVENWTLQYPLEIFPDPDYKQVREVLEASGITLDCVTAGIVRRMMANINQVIGD
jgi:hypothetical protein